MAPIVLGALGKEVTSRGLSAGGLSDLLFSHKKAILDSPYVPKGLAGALGVGNLSELGGSAATVAGPTVSTVETARTSIGERVERVADRVKTESPHAKKKSNWGIMLLPALLLGGLAVWGLSSMFKGRPNMPEVNMEAPNVRAPTMKQPGVEEPQAGAPSVEVPKVEAPSANVPQIPEAHREMAAMTEKTVHFQSGTTHLTPDSKDDVAAVLSYLASNPTSRIRIEGFADSTGSAESNHKLSENRATALKAVLVAHGVKSDRIETTGMGDDNPIAPNDSSTDRARNRRAEITLIH